MQNIDLHSDVSHGAIIDNRYQVLELIHPGQQEILTKAIDKTLDNEIIFLKVFHITRETAPEDLERFEQEVRISRKLSHPNIARIFDIGTFDSHYRYITQANVRGVDIETFVSANKASLTLEICLDIIYRLCNAVSHAHEQGILHRNISDTNVYIDVAEGALKHLTLMNFGHGKLIGSNLSLTKTGEVIGLSTYTAPEQIRGERIDERADIYSIGMLAYELLTGEKPSLQTQQPLILRAMTVGDSLPAVSTINKKIPSWVDTLVQKAVASDREERFKSARDMRDYILSHTKRKSSASTKRSVRELFLKSVQSKISKKQILGMGVFSFLAACLSFAIFLGVFEKPEVPEAERESSRKMFAAIYSKDEPAVYRLLKEGVNPHLKNAEATPLLVLSAQVSQTNIAYTILSKDPSTITDIDIEGRTALIHAVLHKQHELVKLCMNFKADPHFKDMHNKSALDYAKELKDDALVKLLKR